MSTNSLFADHTDHVLKRHVFIISCVQGELNYNKRSMSPVSCWVSCMGTAGREQDAGAKNDMTDYHPYMAPGGGCAEPFKTHNDHSV